MVEKGILIVVSGPSGAGKGTLVKSLMERNKDLTYSVSTTTRSPRAGEIAGVNYWFVSRESFQSMLDKGEMLEWAEVYGNFYGTPYSRVAEQLNMGKSVILEIDTQGAMQIRAKFPGAVFIFILPPSVEELAERLNKRGTDSAESIEHRLSCIKRELSFAYNYHYIVVNDDIDIAVGKMKAIIAAEKCRVIHNADIVEFIAHTGAKYENI